jgi:hypothetical protein
MKIVIARIFAGFITLTAIGMSAAAALERGGTALDQTLMVAFSVAVCGSCHLILAISRSRLSWALWAFCMIGSVYSHVTFLSYAGLRAGEERAHHSTQRLNIDRQTEAIREALAGISARPVTVVADELSHTKRRRERIALEAELSESKRAVVLREELIKLASNASVTEITGTTDLVTTGISKVAGSNQSNVALVASLLFSIMLELIGTFLWYEILQHHTVQPNGRVHRQDKQKAISEVKEAIASGKIKPRVKDIRVFLGCGQARAMEVRRSLNSK